MYNHQNWIWLDREWNRRSLVMDLVSGKRDEKNTANHWQDVGSILYPLKADWHSEKTFIGEYIMNPIINNNFVFINNWYKEDQIYIRMATLSSLTLNFIKQIHVILEKSWKHNIIQYCFLAIAIFEASGLNALLIWPPFLTFQLWARTSRTGFIDRRAGTHAHTWTTDTRAQAHVIIKLIYLFFIRTLPLLVYFIQDFQSFTVIYMITFLLYHIPFQK